METDRLKTQIWVQAQMRLCAAAGLNLVVERKGDTDAGMVCLKLDRLDGTVQLYAQARSNFGDMAWRAPLERQAVPEADAAAYIGRQLSFDPDLWVVVIEDPEGQYQLDRQVID